MPALPPQLYNELVDLCVPCFTRPEERKPRLNPILSSWPGRNRLNWRSNPRTFTKQLLYRLPPEHIQSVVYQLLADQLEAAQIEGLCSLINSVLDQTTAAANAGPFELYHLEIASEQEDVYQIDEQFIRLTLLLDQGEETQGIRFVPDSKKKDKYDSLAALLDDIDERAIVLLGKPGSGKTTLLRRRQWEHAWAELETPNDQVSFFVPLNSYRSPGPGQPLLDPYDWLAEEWHIQYPDLLDFRTLYQSGRMLLLLDGLNEMPHRDKEDYRQRIGRWQTFWQRTRRYGNTLIFSCRSLDYSASLSGTAAPVRQVRVEPLTEEQIAQFLSRYLPEQGTAVWEELRRDPRQVELFSTPFFLRLLVGHVTANNGRLPAGQADLLTGFVRRALQRELVEHRQQLFTAGLLLTQNDRDQIIQNWWDEDDPCDLPDSGPLLPQLEHLAYQMQAGRKSEESGQVRLPEQKALAYLQPPEMAPDILAAGCQLNILDKDPPKKEITYFHQLIQEYFAGRILARQPEPDRLTVAWRSAEVTPSLAEELARLEVSDPLPPLPAGGWEESALLAAAMNRDQEQFVTNLAQTNLPLAGRCAALPEVAVSPALEARLRAELAARMADPQADLRARIAAGEALGPLGHPDFERREGPYGPYLRPPLTPILAGTYPIGDDDGQYEDEKPAHTVEIAALEMAVYPLTNAEYALFMAAGGYEEERWWQTEAARAWRRGAGSNEGQKAYWRDVHAQLKDMTDEAIQNLSNMTPEQVEGFLQIKHFSAEEMEKQVEKWYPTGKVHTQPEYWDDGRFNQPLQPVVGITWHEARAYCAWLSGQTGETYDLPTEAEWEATARGKAGRTYSWGKKYDAARCNTFETHIRHTTPIGVFPDGRTPEKVADMSGNVWEWTSTIYKPYPYAVDDGREDPSDPDSRRVLRGGSWDDDQHYARAAYRFHGNPGNRYGNVGVRVCRRAVPHLNAL